MPPRKLGSWISVNSILLTAIGELRRTPTLRLPMSLARQGAFPKPCFFARSLLYLLTTNSSSNDNAMVSRSLQWRRCRSQAPVSPPASVVGYAMLLKIGSQRDNVGLAWTGHHRHVRDGAMAEVTPSNFWYHPCCDARPGLVLVFESQSMAAPQVVTAVRCHPDSAISSPRASSQLLLFWSCVGNGSLQYHMVVKWACVKKRWLMMLEKTCIFVTNHNHLSS
jgi:hypothetical protein